MLIRNRQEDLLAYCRDYAVLRQMRDTRVHYLLSNGNHTDEFFDFAPGFAVYDFRKEFGLEFMEKLGKHGCAHDIDAILTPAMGGVLFCETLQNLFYGRKPVLLYAEKVNGVLQLRRNFNFKLDDSKRVILLDDVRTSGKSLLRLKEICEGYEAMVAVMGAIVDRGPERDLTKQAEVIPEICLIRYPIHEYKPDECKFCEIGVPLEKDGSLVDISGNKFISEQVVE